MAKYNDGLDKYSEELHNGSLNSSEYSSLTLEEIKNASDETLKSYLGQLYYFDETVRGSIEYMILEELNHREMNKKAEEQSL